MSRSVSDPNMKKQTLSGLMIVTHTNEEQQPPVKRQNDLEQQHFCRSFS